MIVITPEQLKDCDRRRRRLIAKGHSVVVVITRSKQPAGKDWPERALDNECLRFGAVPHSMNDGLLANGRRFFDIDVDAAALVARIEAVIRRICGGNPPTRFRADSPRKALMYRAFEGSPPTLSITGNLGKLQVLGHRTQLLAFGVHPDGCLLQWDPSPEDVTANELPMITEAQVYEVLREVAAILEAELPRVLFADLDNGVEHTPSEPQADVARIADALMRIPNDGPADWEWWNKLLMALFAATGGSDLGRELAHRWSALNPCYDPAETDARWRHFRHSPPSRLGAGSLFYAADAAIQEQLGDFLDIGLQAKLPGVDDQAGQSPQEEAEETTQSSEEPGQASDEGPAASASDGATEGLDPETAAKWKRAAEGADAGAQPELPDLTVLRLNRRPPPVCPVHVFGPRWAAWIKAGASSACCPVDYVVGPLLAVASVLIGNARLAEGSANWLEPPVLDIASVGDSGDSKSPGSDVLFRYVIPEIERRMLGDFPDRLAVWKTAEQVAKVKEEAWKADVAKAIKAGAPPPPRPADIDIAPEPQQPRLVQNDVTIEKVAHLLATAAPKGLLTYRDELAGFLMGMTAYNDSGRQFWLESYGGRRYVVERIKFAQPIIVPHLSCGIFGTIQPERLDRWLDTDPDDGFASRFCWIWPEPVPFQLPSTVCDATFAIEALDLLRQLDMFEIAGELRPIQVPLVRTAWPALERFGQRMQAEQKMTAGLLRSTYGKARGLALRLALIIELLWWVAGGPGITLGAPTVISAAAFDAACEFVSEYILPMAARTYGDAALDKPQRNAAMLARWIAEKRPPEVHVRNLQRQVRLAGLHTADDIHAACKELIEAQWLLSGSRSGGNARLRTTYPINPKLWEALDAAAS